jgi:SagB-type dehydrogenase family enzyme
MTLLDRLLAGDNQLEPAWEAFHMASKTSPLDAPPSAEAVHARMLRMAPAFAYDGYPTHALPPPPRLDDALSDMLVARSTARDIGPTRLSDAMLSALMFYCAGETRDETASGFPRPFRVAPSGGATYPLELYLAANDTITLAPGLHHYQPGEHALRRLSDGDQRPGLRSAFVQPQLVDAAAAFVFITGVFERATFKYGERGYRFALLEAGHVAQNLLLTAAALGLGAVPVGGFLDREADRLLGLDGLDRSTLYVVAIGGRSGENWLGV